MSDTLDLTTVSDEPVESNVQVEITDADPDTEEPVPDAGEPVADAAEAEEEAPEETPEEPVEEAPVEESPVEEVASEEPVAPEVVTEEPVEEEPVEESKEESVAPVEQVAADIRSILTEVPAVSTDSSELSDDLKQRIAELDFLRECCGNWVKTCRGGRSNFLNAWSNKSVSVDTSINYEDVLIQLEKFPEIIKLWAERKVNTDSNHFKNIESYTLNKSLFNDKSNEEKVEVLEKLIDLLINCANRKMRINQIEEFIDNLY